MFQFALPHGERRQRVSRAVVVTPVSIRAPAWGATSCTSPGWWRRWFQFVPSRVGDVVRCAALRTVRRSRNRPLDAFALWAELPIVVSMSAIVS